MAKQYDPLKMTEAQIEAQIEKLTSGHITLSTKLSAFASMFDAYWAAYISNEREAVEFMAAKTYGLARTADQFAEVRRTHKNKINRLDNLDAQFSKLNKLARKEFKNLDGVDEFLLDKFDEFWSKNVVISENQIAIKDE